jgi:branched-chain amino acid transport system ATP-binding protein
VPPDAPLLLEARDATKAFGGLTAVRDFRLALRPGEMVGLIGPNGAGKTTVFNLLTGVYRLSAGEIAVAGRSTAGLKPNRITELGIARTFQNIRLFNDLSVIDNVRVACDFRAHYGLLAGILGARRARRAEREIHEKALALLRLFELEDREHEIARNLAYGQQRRLEIARALATEPKVLLLDEPAAGMNPRERTELMERIRWLRRERGLTILLIEHDMKFVMGICERIVVLDHGMIIAEGAPEEIRTNPAVIEAYLGRADAGPPPGGPGQGAADTGAAP